MKFSISGGAVECSSRYASRLWRDFYQAILDDQLTGVRQVKHDATTTVYFAQFEGIPLVIKRYNTKNTWHFVRRGFRQSRADICYHMADHYQRAGISTPQPIAAIQAKSGPFKLRSWYICHHIQGALFDQHIQQLEHTPTPAMRTAIAEMFGQLKAYRLSHGDMKASNLIWHNDRIHVIDLDAARHHRWHSFQQRALNKDILRFLENWPDGSNIVRTFTQSFDTAGLLPPS